LIELDVGYCASKGECYFGMKGAIRIASNGMIVHAPLVTPRPHDTQFTHTLLADKAFLDQDKQTELAQRQGVLLLTPKKSNSIDLSFGLPALAKPIR